MRKYQFMYLLLIVSLGVLVGCSKDSSNSYSMTPTPTPTPQPNTIAIANMAFSPATMTIAKGTTITWKNDDGVAHTSTSNSGAWDTGNISPGGSATTMFSTAGTFPFHCSYHPTMTGTIVVQ